MQVWVETSAELTKISWVLLLIFYLTGKLQWWGAQSNSRNHTFSFSVRKKVLKHHPDKKSSKTDSKESKLSEQSLFACITIANDILSNKTKRRAYDSVDSFFDDSIPSVSANSKSNFFEVFGPVFERNARWVFYDLFFLRDFQVFEKAKCRISEKGLMQYDLSSIGRITWILSATG